MSAANVTIHKRNAHGELQLSYEGRVVARGDDFVCVRAIFQGKTRDLGYMYLKQGDVFTEWFYTARWYNIFRIEDVDSGLLKGFYCNLTRPAKITLDSISADDLELDVFVSPAGNTLMLDEDEYAALTLTDNEHANVQRAVLEIKRFVRERLHPFDELPAP